MENRLFKNSKYLETCSERTLQTNKEGFFMCFVNQVLENVGKKWINESFAKAKNDNHRIRMIYQHQPASTVITELFSHVQEIYRNKNAEISQQKRREAELALKNRENNKKILNLYSQSILRAPKVGDNKKIDNGYSLIFAFWGRSEILISLKKYKLALIDLQLCLKEDLPNSFKGEAFSKMAICYRGIGEESRAKVAMNLSKKFPICNNKSELLQKQYEETKIDLEETKNDLPKVSGKKHPNLEFASDKIQIKEAKGLGRYVVAKKLITTGETLVVEPAYVACLLPDEFGTHCIQCFERLISPIGCPDCSNVAFCTPECKDIALQTYHKHECKYLDLLIGSGMSILSHCALRMITQNSLNKNLDDYEKKSQFPFFLCSNANKRTSKDFLQRTLMAAFLLRILQKSGYFGKTRQNITPNEDEYKIAELILHHLQILQFNAHEIYETRHNADNRFHLSKCKYIGVAIYPTVSMFNHDCAPCVSRYFVGKQIVIKSSKLIRPGELISENYGPIFTRMSLQERQRSLSGRYWFNCQCLACIQDWPSSKSGLDKVSRRIRCPNNNCDYFFTLPMREEDVQCPKCRISADLREAREKLEWCEKQYELGLKILESTQNPVEAIKILCSALDTFYRISRPPHEGTHLAQETLRACFADFGNKFECLIKTK